MENAGSVRRLAKNGWNVLEGAGRARNYRKVSHFLPMSLRVTVSKMELIFSP